MGRNGLQPRRKGGQLETSMRGGADYSSTLVQHVHNVRSVKCSFPQRGKTKGGIFRLLHAALSCFASSLFSGEKKEGNAPECVVGSKKDWTAGLRKNGGWQGAPKYGRRGIGGREEGEGPPTP